MSFYSYSVKETLESYFGPDTVFSMRKDRDRFYKNEEKDGLLPLSWKYADQEATGLYLEDLYLIDTIITDDYT